jgi:hypothetical protein
MRVFLRSLILVALSALVVACADGAVVQIPAADLATVKDVQTRSEVESDRFVPWQPEVTPPELAVVETWLSEEITAAGSGPVTVTCMGYDAAGNYVGVGPSHLAASSGLKVDGLTVESTVAGEYEVQCVPNVAVVATLETAILTVVPGAAATISVTPKPNKEVYLVGHSLTLLASGEDAYGNPIDEVELAGVLVAPAKLAKVVLGKVTFLAEGAGTVSAHVAGDPSVTGSFPVLVDAGAPVIEIDTPARGQQLLGPGPVEITGSVTDATGLSLATLNGQKLQLAADGSFTTSVPGEFGLNMLIIEAEDELGNGSRHVQSFVLAGAYAPVADGPVEALMLPGGIKAWLDYDAFKGSGTNGVTLSQIAQLGLSAFDLAALIPSPVSQQEILVCTYDVYLENLTYGEPVLEIWPLQTGLTVHAKFPDLVADLSMPAPWCPDVEGQVTAAAVTITALVAVDLSSSGEVMVEMTSVDVQFVGLDIDLYGVTGNLVQAVLSFFEDDLADMVESQFEAEAQGQVEMLLEQYLGVVSVDQWIELPPFMPSSPTTPAEIHLRGSSLETSYGGMEFDIDAAFTTVDKKHLDLLGAPRRLGCMTGPPVTPEITTQHYLEVAMHDDVLSQSVFTKFLSGGIDFVLTAESMAEMGNDFGEFGVENLSIVANAFLPPIMTDCAADGAFRIQLGELRLKISLTMLGMPLEMTLYLYFSAKSVFEIVGEPGAQQLQFTFSELDWVDYHIDEINEEWVGNEALFGELIEETFLAEFVNLIQEFPYTIEVSEMPVGDLLPLFSGWTLVPVLDTILRKPGQLLVRAHLLLEE